MTRDWIDVWFRNMLDRRSWPVSEYFILNGEVVSYIPGNDPLEEQIYYPLFWRYPDPVIDLDKPLGKIPDPRKYT